MKIVSRSEWKARPPKSRHTIKTPTPELWLHHSAGSGANESTVRAIQNFHMNPPPKGRGWSDIAYSFLVDNDAPDIDIFEGRGAGVAGGHTAGRNTISHAICIIGDFSTKAPHPETLEAVAQLAAYGYLKGWWRLGFTGGHRDAPGAATSCPGDALYKLIPSINKRIEEIVVSTFTDVSPNNPHADDIEWLAETGIARGTNPPKNDKFSPNAPVTRAQLATFLRRFDDYLRRNAR